MGEATLPWLGGERGDDPTPPRSFLDLLPEPRRRAMLEAKRLHEAAVAHDAALDDDALVVAIGATLNALPDAAAWSPGQFVYNASCYHVLIPEFVHRLTGRVRAPFGGWPVSDVELLRTQQARYAAADTPDVLVAMTRTVDNIGLSRGGYCAHVPGAGRLFHALLPTLQTRVATIAYPDGLATRLATRPPAVQRARCAALLASVLEADRITGLRLAGFLACETLF